ncbi:tetraspanin-31-B-like isoform X1 [Anneissia japonica]|uniref:tetraspanin-31-B-like isoform X1 n=1 Tax=Anneissia japonica TaxID=1529436 RepID=UPI00142581A2|nr:tetraspanin-31-B-like isoform X1 [Anneissia japonica]
MGCGDFHCSRNALIALNTLYILVSIILISVAATAQYAAVVTSTSVIGGIIACGVFLLIVALIGLVGAIKHHQVLLFFYMVILVLLFLIQLFVSIGCLVYGESKREEVIKYGWEHEASSKTKAQVQKEFECCSLNGTYKAGDPPCVNLKCCSMISNATNQMCLDDNNCPSCLEELDDLMHKALRTVGGVGLFFSFTELFGVFWTYRYRNQKDPRANPNAFL